jgi:PAS domain S-box-containing protein
MNPDHISNAQWGDSQTLRMALEASGMGLWSWDAGSGSVSWDDQTCRIFGCEPGKGPASYDEYLDRLHPEDRSAVHHSVSEALRTGIYRDIEHRILRPDGSVRWLLGKATIQHSPHGRFLRMIGGIIDITEQVEARRAETQKAEKLLQAASRQNRDLFENSPDAIARISPEGRYLVVNRRLAEFGNRQESDLVGGYIGSVSGLDPKPWIEIIRRIVKTGKGETSEFAFRSPALNRDLHVQLRFVPELDEDQNVRSVLLIITDISDQRQAEAAARDHAALISALVDTASQAILAIDAQGSIRLANQMAEQILGYGRNELLGKNHEVLIPEQFRKRHARLRAGYMRNPQTRPMGTGMLEGRRKDGTLFPVEITLSQIVTQDGSLTVIMLSDITIRRRHEKQLEQDKEELEKLSQALITAEADAAGAIARELHDDITQRLALLSIDIGKAASAFRPGARFLKELRSLQSRAKDIAEAVRKLAHETHPAIVEDLGLSAAIEALCSDVSQAGRLRVRFESHAVPESLDRNVALNIYRIAQEALTNVAKHASAGDCQVTLNGHEDGLQLEIVDSGNGFVPDISGEGLGLRSMRERMLLVKGTFRVESQPEGRTRVIAYSPIRSAT